MVLKFQDNLGHFTSMCINGQDDVIKVCHDYCSNPHACSEKGIAKNDNLSKEVIVPKETYFPLDNIYEELPVQIMPESVMLGLHQFLWLFSVFKSVCYNSKLSCWNMPQMFYWITLLVCDQFCLPRQAFNNVYLQIHAV